ncbi:MAG: CBS and ACT domain-containing protein [Anaerolineales bacterium]|jgi:acetoin utilization protein AcuB
MLVGERMTHPVVFVSPKMSIQDALQLMKKENIRRTPVVEGGKLIGIVSDKDLLNASPSDATSLSVWELNYLLSKITVAEVMTGAVITVTEDTPIEEAARIMSDNKIGGLPVVKDGSVVGIITETDLFRLLLELTGAREFGVRATFLLEDKPGELAKVTSAIAENGGNVIAIGTFSGDDQATREILMKVSGVDDKTITKILEDYAIKVKDIRFCCN